MIAYLILVHRYPEQFKRMFRAIYVPGNHYLIHIDKSSGPAFAASITQFLAPYQNAAILPAKKAVWGGYSLVDAELRGMQQLLAMGADWKYFINLSGQDFPLKSQAYIADFLTEHDGTQFIRAVDQRLIRPDTMNRLSHYFLEAFSRIWRTGIPRKYMRGVTPFIGTQWKAVTRDFCAFVCNDPAINRYKRYYRGTLIADEGFFQTVMKNAFPHESAANDDLRTIDWVPDGDIKLRPRTFTADDTMRLTLSPDLFARKFDATEDAEILDILEAHLETPKARLFQRSSYTEPARADSIARDGEAVGVSGDPL
ncbi:beta-1,6-N-acetylglucosaminyltransferase [Sphingobium sufflavum]|uniref:beta-1,6-N-acetylglucosaminyltransferase n=1 Tax=Sphingobium sufflavum TaxID=1129547 RepID=UPI001F20BD86|nr:beta-1,6-N-acetylglucosaminyltransferase [Sphingobium sufflavum]MCE7796159.1 beta-1,6-N-acetylglucosaminyltransferase [Sphingobium sufflavum]